MVIYKQIHNVPNNRDIILKAVTELAEPVKRTLGPEGLPILIQRQDNVPLSTKDGVTVANSIFSKDQAVDTVIQSIKESAKKTNEEAGDGTTTAIVLTEALVKEGFKLIGMDVVNPQELVSKLKYHYEKIVEELENISQPIENEEQQKNVALISSNNDKEVSEKVIEAIGRAGQDGFITIDDGATLGIEVTQLEGYKLDSGFHKLGTIGSTFITHPQKQAVILNMPMVVFFNGEMSDINDFSQFLINLTKKGTEWPTSLVIIAHDFSGPFLNFVMSNRDAGAPLFLIKTPIMGSPVASRPLLLNDLAVYCGASAVVEQKPHAFTEIIKEENYKQKYLGTAGRINIERYHSTVYEGWGTSEDANVDFAGYIEVLKAQIKDAESDWDRDFVRTRIGKMCDGLVKIEVGGKTNLEIAEKKARVEDALNATKAAIEQGILPGGGCALFYASSFLDSTDFIENCFRKVLQYPIKQILKNAGCKADVVMDKIEKNFRDNCYYGFNVQTKKYENDLIKAGVIDPLKVTKSALANAFSIASQLLINGGTITNDV